MTYEVQFQHEGAEYTVRGPDIDGVLRLIQGVQGVGRVPPLGPVPDPHAELRKTWAPGQKWQTRHRRATEWVYVGGVPAWHPDQEYRKCA
jgi:hypothetical protein